MQEIGEISLDKEVGYKTNIKVMWKLKHGATKFDLCNALIILMKKIQQVDDKAYFQSSITNNVHKQPGNIPTGETFNKEFAMKQDYIRNDPPLVTAFVTILSNLKVNTISFDNTVFNYIKHHDVYICPDHFSWNNIVSPGMVFGVHLTLVHIKDYKTECDCCISHWLAPENNEVVKEWVTKHTHTGSNAKVPEFKIITVWVEWGEGANRIETTAFKFLCKEEDRLYFKALLAAAYSRADKPCGIFIPSKAWLITSPEKYRAA
eukprot:4563989-Ditylum_brightwellii.AAC.1